MPLTNRNLISAYIFNASAKTVTLTGITPVELKRLFSIINMTRGVVYFRSGDTALIPAIAANVITLNTSVSTSGHADTDEIHVAYIENDANFGTDINGVAQSVGGAGVRGWLSEMASLLRKGNPEDKLLPTPAVGQSLQNQNLLLATAGTGWLDIGDPINGSYRGLQFNLDTTAGITAGQVIFEGAANPLIGLIYPLYRVEGTGSATTNSTSLTASASRAFEVSSPYRYVRVRISIAVVGGTVGITDLYARREIKTSIAPISIGTNASINVAQVNGVNTSTGSGASGTGSQRVVTATDSTIGTLSAITNLGISTFATTAFRSTAVLAAPIAVKTSAGRIHGMNIHNPNGTTVYLKIFAATAASTTVGTTAVAKTYTIPATGNLLIPTQLIALANLSTAITIAAVTGLSDGSTTAAASALIVEIDYV
jgi:hypothetical protein